MAGTAVINLKKEQVTHNGAAPFDIAPFVPHIQQLVTLGVLTEAEHVDKLLNPPADRSADQYGRWLAKICAECGEYMNAIAIIDPVLARNPDDGETIKIKLKLLQDIGEDDQARALKKRLNEVMGATPPTGTLEPEDVGLAYRLYEGEFFYRDAWDTEGPIGKAFVKWATKNHEDLVEGMEDDVRQMEGLIEDEEGGEAMADFINNLSPAIRKDAFAGMKKALLHDFGDDDDEEIEVDDEVQELVGRIDQAIAALN